MRDERQRWILLGLAGIVLLLGLQSPGLYDPNEGLYAEVGREMYQSGDWLTPRFNGVVYFEKPPLTYWLIASSDALLGVSEQSARLPIALCALAGVMFTFGIGRALFEARVGFMAGLALLTSFGYFIFSRIILTDLVFTACVTASLWAFVRGYLEPERGGFFLGMYAFAGLAVLAKGLLGLVVPGLTLGALIVATRDWTLLRTLRVPLGTLVLLAVAAPWHVAMCLTDGDFFWFYFVNEHVLRFFNARHLTDYAPLPLWIFVLMALVWSLPWSLFVVFARPRLMLPSRETRAGRAVWIIPCWVGAVLGFFALTPARLEYYSLPALPAIAIWASRAWDDALHTPGARARLGWALALFLAVGATALPLAASFPKLEGAEFYNIFPAIDAYSRDIDQGILRPPGSYTVPSFRDLLPALLLAAGVFFSGSLAAFVAERRRRTRVAFACIAVTMLGIFPIIHQGMVLFEPHRSVRELADQLAAERRPGDAIVVDGPYENFAGLDLYTGSLARVLEGRFGDLEFGSERADTASRFLDEDRFEKLWHANGRVFLVTGSAHRVASLQPAHGSSIVARSDGKWLLRNRP